MATFRLPILGWSTVPDTSGNVWFEPFTVLATNDVWGRLIARFKDTSTRIGLKGGFVVPKNYTGTAKLVIVWTSSTATSGNVVWDFDYRTVGGDNANSLDQSGTEESVTVTDSAPTAVNRRLEVLISLTSGNFAADEEVTFELFRDGADGSDTMNGDATLFSLMFEYVGT